MLWNSFWRSILLIEFLHFTHESHDIRNSFNLFLLLSKLNMQHSVRLETIRRSSTQNLIISRCCFVEDEKKCSKSYKGPVILATFFFFNCLATLVHCKLQHIVARITTLVANLSFSKIQFCKMRHYVG